MAVFNGYDSPAVQSINSRLNGSLVSMQIDRSLMRKPERYFNIYSVSSREFKVSLMPLIPSMMLKACPKDKKYELVARIPDPFMQKIRDNDNGGERGADHDGLRVAIDLINPNNLTYDPDFNPDTGLAVGCNLLAQGLFIVEEGGDVEAGADKAISRREKYYTKLVDEMRRLESLDRKGLQELLDTNPDCRIALDYFGITTDYHKDLKRKEECPNCGTEVKAGTAYHMLGSIICVIDWKRAVEAGVKTKDEVPEHLRWWNGPGRPRT